MAEISDHYKRGILKLKAQVRSCDDATCSGENFMGPDGTTSDYYEWDETRPITTPSHILSNVADNRYFQYRMFFETDDANYTPELKSITVDTNPTVSSFSPADDATDIATNSNLVITFDENVDAESGNIYLYKTNGDVLIQTFDVTSDISGSGTDTITINPTLDLNELTSYYIKIDTTAFDDSSSNSYAGIADATTWNFTTADETPPNVPVIITPVNNSTTSDTTPTFTGTGEPGATVNVDDGSGHSCSATVDAAGDWTCDITTPFNDGDTPTFNVTQADPAGNTSPATTVHLTVDDGDGVPADEEDQAPNQDGNGDGVRDAIQSNVTTVSNSVTGSYTTIETDNQGNCRMLSNFHIVKEENLAKQDKEYTYPVGLNDFIIHCTNPGESTKITFYYDKEYNTNDWKYRKYDSNNKEYSDISNIVTFSTKTVNGKKVTTASFILKDGESKTDQDKIANSVIIDPSGPAVNSNEEGKASIGNTIWLDENNNGKQDKDEEGLEDIRVKLIWYGLNGKYDHGKKDDKVYRTKTNHNGHYKFEDLPKGKYRVIVKEEDVAKYVQTYDPDNEMDGMDKITIRRNKQNYTKADFGYNNREEELAKTGESWWDILIKILE